MVESAWGPYITSVQGLEANSNDRTYWELLSGGRPLSQGKRERTKGPTCGAAPSTPGWGGAKQLGQGCPVFTDPGVPSPGPLLLILPLQGLVVTLSTMEKIWRFAGASTNTRKPPSAGSHSCAVESRVGMGLVSSFSLNAMATRESIISLSLFACSININNYTAKECCNHCILKGDYY